jgi:Asp-tRNA(Asn)/Glu-tRNA(Gln) amidotransferase A subunit family amidase
MFRQGVVPPTPAIERAVSTTVAALTAAGHTVKEIAPPKGADPFTGLNLASQLLNSDGCHHFNAPLRSFEPSDPGANQLSRVAHLPRPLRYLYYLYVRYIRRDKVLATLLRNFGPKTAAELWPLTAQRETFRATWHQWWDAPEQQFDFILCPVNATPALPHKAMHDAVSSCGYTFLWNLLDYSAGVLPVAMSIPSVMPSSVRTRRRSRIWAATTPLRGGRGSTTTRGRWRVCRPQCRWLGGAGRRSRCWGI